MATTLIGEDLAAALHGAVVVERRSDGIQGWRLRESDRRTAPAALALMSEFGAGTRLRLRTAATRLTLDVTVTRLLQIGQSVPEAPAPFAVVLAGVALPPVFTEATAVAVEHLDPVSGRRHFVRSGTGRQRIEVELPISDDAGVERTVEIWLPHDAATTVHAVEASEPVVAAAPRPSLRWIHHGSSISHGGSAAGPLDPWPTKAALALGMDGMNLGFGGNAMLDSVVARTIAATPAKLISLKFGINVVGADAMRRRAFESALHNFLDLIRDVQPTTPLVLLTAIACPAVETQPGPIRRGSDGRIAAAERTVIPDVGALTLEHTRMAVRQVAADRADDAALWLMEGTELFSEADVAQLPDGLHPDTAGHALMADRFVAAARNPLTPLGQAMAAAAALP